jgi:hypothetical protein
MFINVTPVVGNLKGKQENKQIKAALAAPTL